MAKIKICGLFRSQDIDSVNEAMPDYIGFVFAPSKRQISAKQALKLCKRLSDKIIPVGVFVDAPAEEILHLYQAGIIKIAQLHGSENEEYIKRLRSSCAMPIIKAVKVETTDDILAYEHSGADYLLLDNIKGGSGKSFDWSSICRIRKPFFLAGGINTQNIDRALSYFPYCIDVSSGAESNGNKDKEKILRLVQAVKGGNPHGICT
jgi:phosphoribosylanthranilate isomerase